MRELYTKLFESTITPKEQYAILDNLRQYSSTFEYRKRIAPIVASLVQKKIMKKKEIYAFVYLSEIPMLHSVFPQELWEYTNIEIVQLTPESLQFFIEHNVPICNGKEYITLDVKNFAYEDWEKAHQYYGIHIFKFKFNTIDHASLNALTKYVFDKNLENLPSSFLQQISRHVINSEELTLYVLHHYQQKRNVKKTPLTLTLYSEINKNIPSENLQKIEKMLMPQKENIENIWTLKRFIQSERDWFNVLSYNGTADDFLNYLVTKDWNTYVKKYVLPKLQLSSNFYENILAFRQKLLELDIFYNHFTNKETMAAFCYKEAEQPNYLNGVVHYLDNKILEAEITGLPIDIDLSRLMSDYEQFNTIHHNPELPLL